MEKIFNNPSELERLVKQKFGFPDFVMMENAALAMKNLIEQGQAGECLILCGKGNNGGDGYALARLLGNEYKIFLYAMAEPTAAEAKTQYEICKKLKYTFLSSNKVLELLKKPSENLIIVDCLFGTGFHGELPQKEASIIQAANKACATRIACDISSGLAFNADYTVTMGEQKLSLFSDKAKSVNGKIIVAPLGIDRNTFENQSKPQAFLITADDMKLPLRNNKATHKGSFGHTAIYAGEKSGAAIICATAAMNFGSGLTTLIETEHSNLGQFKISPELMLSKLKLPAKTNCVVFGPGTADSSLPDDSIAKVSSLVFDAGVFGNPDFIPLLKKLDSRPGSRIVLTPHLLELVRFCKNLKIKPEPCVEDLANNPELKIQIGQKINRLFPNTVLVMKSAFTFIAAQEQSFIIADGEPSLAKGGSGDVLAGMIAALLSQGYSAKDAAISACQAHALASKKIGGKSYGLTPQKLIKTIGLL